MNKDANYLILFLIILFMMWYSQGGHFNTGGIIMDPQGGSSISAPGSSATGDTSTSRSGGGTTASGSKDSVEIFSQTADRTIYPAEEYIMIRAGYGNKNPVNITGWTLKNKNNETIMIGYGTKLPYSADANKQEDIMLEPRDEATVITGKSPIGTSFRLNLCTGYFNQYQTFIPSLPQDCPAPSQTPGLNDLAEDSCISLIEGQSRCRVPTNLSNYLSDACSGFITQHLNYSGCVNDYKNDKDFYSAHKWYVYLGRDNEFWRDTRGKVMLYDRLGNLAAETTY
jgi:hypothetical protein